MQPNSSKVGLLETVAEYNEAAKNKSADIYPLRTEGDGSFFSPEKYEPLETGPFYCWPARPYIYHTYGGVAIDLDCRVLDKNRNPIPGLYAASPTAGGVMGFIYQGSMGSASATGYMAGRCAAAELAK